jgi:3-oxoacyl-[acyl-carrier protein] reductase
VKTVLVVGGASGIGLASAKIMASNGWRVVLGGRHQGRLLTEVAKLISKGHSADSVVMDVTSAASVESAFKQVLGKYELNSLIYAAGVPQFGTILDVKEADWDLVLGTNLKGAYLTCQAAVSAFLVSGGGTIVNIASQSGRTSSFYSAPNYVASKAGLIGLTMALAKQHAAQGIRVNCVAPGLVETPLPTTYTEEQRVSMMMATPIGRFASPEEIADVVLFLAADQSSYMTGQTLNVNGGSFMQ